MGEFLATMACRAMLSRGVRSFAVTRPGGFRCVAAARFCSAPAKEPELPIPPYILEIADKICLLNLLEATQLNDALKDKLGISDVPMGMPMMAAPAAEEVVEQTEFEIVLEGFDATSKIKVIKEVRAVAGLGLKEAKTLVEGAPKSIKDGLSKEDAEELKTKLEAIGAKIAMK